MKVPTTLFLSLVVLLAGGIKTPAQDAKAPVSLFDGKMLDGWDYDPAIWRVEDGVITGGSRTEKITPNYFIATKRSFQNFELRLKIKCGGDPKTGLISSGIQVRSVRVPGGHHMSGYQVDCGAGWFGEIYDEARRNRVIWTPTPEQQTALDKVVDVFGWNEYRIRAEGPRIQTWINGVLCIDYTEADKNIAHLLAGRFDRASKDKTYAYYLLTHLQAVRQGPWKLHLARPPHPKWLGPHAPNRHIDPRDDLGMDAPQLYHLNDDPGESTDLAARHPEVVQQLRAVAERIRSDIGDHDRVGKSMRFYDPMESRPTTPPTTFNTAKKR